MDYLLGTTKNPQESLEKAIELTQKAIAVDEDFPDGHSYLGWFYSLKGEYDKAVTEGERAVVLNPSGAELYSRYGNILAASGRPDEAIPMLQKAIRLNPFAPSWCFLFLGQALRITGQFEEAVSALKKAIQLAPDDIRAHFDLAATYIMMGREKEARAEAAEVLRINPKFSLDYWPWMLSYKDQSQTDKYINALRKAGLK